MNQTPATNGSGTPNDPWLLKTPSLTSDYQAWRDETLTPPALRREASGGRQGQQTSAPRPWPGAG